MPTQVVEIVRPGRAIDRGEQLSKVDARQVQERDLDTLPPNRLVWTNDNLVALRTLRDERDPRTGDFRYRGKVDLIYIDPPFMVNNDFRADNAIDIELDGEAAVQATKEPSLVEILAYKDTWRQGLDSFLTMLRQRLGLLKELLKPSGSIYVHLDWHAVHYVKVMMDELFGYENFLNEIIWKRTSARSDSKGLNHIHDTIISYKIGENSYWEHVYGPYSSDYIKSHYTYIDESTGRRYRLDNLRSPNPRPNLMYDYKGYKPHRNGWAISREVMEELDGKGLIYYPTKGERLALKRYLDNDGMPLMSIWTDIPPVNSQATERLGYPTQKPVALLERIISTSCPPGGMVLDCFVGSGTTCEAAERLGRRWIGIDNGKYGIHLARKRLIHLHDQPRPPEKPKYDYVECKTCKNIERKEKPQKSPGRFSVRPFTVENMGAYQRAEAWQDVQLSRSRYRDEMIKVFGGKPATGYQFLHGTKGDHWIHVGPLNAPVEIHQVWSIAREASGTELKAVTVLCADYNPLAASSERDIIRRDTGVNIIVRIIPASAIHEVRERLERAHKDPEQAYESMAVPAFYAPLSIVLSPKVEGRTVTLALERCEVDVQSFLDSQRPALKQPHDGMSPAAKKKAQAEIDKWEERRKALHAWLRKVDSWKKFVDFWAIDWDYGRRLGPDDKPIFETDWQSFRVRRGKNDVDDLAFSAEFRYDKHGMYHVAARVTDVFGNDGIATVSVEVR